MQKDNQNNSPLTSTEQPVLSNTGITFTQIFYRTINNWHLLLLSIILCCGLGVLYILRTPNMYSQSAVLVIKDDDEGGSAARDLSSIGLFQNSSNLQNEVATFKSPDLMEEAVKILNLEYSYATPGVFRNKIAYGKDLPIEVSIPGISQDLSAYFKITVSSNGDASISKLRTFHNKDKKEFNTNFKGKLNKPIKTPIGDITLTPTKYYKQSENIELIVNKNSLFSTVECYESLLSVVPDEEGGTVITLSLKSPSIELADNLLTTLIKVYRENWIDEKNEMAVATSNFINDRLQVIEKELGNVDSDISAYKSKNLLPDVSLANETYVQQNRALSDELLSLSSELQMAYHIRDYVISPKNRNSLLPLNVGLTKNNISSAIENYNRKLIERNDLESKSSDQNPYVVSMDNELIAMREAIIGNIDNTIVDLKNQIANIQGAQSETKSKISSSPTQAQILLSVERQQKVKENLYLFLLQKREDNEIEQAFTAQNFRLIQRPGGSNKPVSPHKGMILGGAFLIGLLLPFGAQYFRILTDTKVNDKKDCKGLTMPMLGEIPLYCGKENPQTQVLVKPAMRDAINESFRVLRTNIDFVKPEKQNEAFMFAITSLNPGSGKSFIAMNVATSIAIRNNKVLLIDTDLRRGSSSVYAGSPKQGLADYLSGRVSDVSSLIISPLGTNGPDVLPIGSIPPNPTELIESPLLEKLLMDLKKEYAYIICDCPPIDIVADTRIIDKYMDRTIFIIRAGMFEKSQIPEIETIYVQKRYNNIAYILNGIKTSHSYGKYGYGKQNYYTYGN